MEARAAEVARRGDLRRQEHVQEVRPGQPDIAHELGAQAQTVLGHLEREH
jgi:hypothetical protein